VYYTVQYAGLGGLGEEGEDRDNFTKRPNHEAQRPPQSPQRSRRAPIVFSVAIDEGGSYV
jgi:hypothetical protein